jgi:uncharacterized protein (DUF885 family)
MPREIDRAKLGVAGRADYDILRNEIAAGLFTLRKLRPFERDPMTYSGLLTQPVYDLLKRDFAPLDERVRNAVARMKRIPTVVEAARRNLRSPPKPQTEVALRQIRGAATFYESGLADFVKGSSRADEAMAEGKRLAAVLREYADWVEKDLLPRATDEWRLGKELWEEKLRYSLNSSLGPDEIQARARSEFDRVRGEMYVLSKALWPLLFEGTALPQGDEALRTTVRAVIDAVSREHSTREGIVDDAREVIGRLRDFLRERDLVTLPDPDRLSIIVMPEFQAGVSTAYLDPAPPLEPAGRSFYAVEPMPSSASDAEVESRLREYNSYMLDILSIHEGYPGHYVQLEHSNRFPSRIRRIFSNGPMVEGWAVYTERMMVENGWGGGNPKLKLNQLKFYLRAVTNALIDRGLHVDGMSEEAALDLMMQGAFQEANEAVGKLRRAQVTSTQLSTYFVGFQEVQSLREDVERAESAEGAEGTTGPGFSLKSFHDRFLSQGSPPVRVIRDVILPKP